MMMMIFIGTLFCNLHRDDNGLYLRQPLSFWTKNLGIAVSAPPFPLDVRHDAVIFERVGRFHFCSSESLVLDNTKIFVSLHNA